LYTIFFLIPINADADTWLATWNSHSLARGGQQHQIPQQLYLHGMIQNGVRGVHVEDLDNVDPDIYGIDWEDIDHPRFRNHYNTHNPRENGNPFVVNHPSHLSRVDVFDPHSHLIQDKSLF
jgi:hypothetical protein